MRPSLFVPVVTKGQAIGATPFELVASTVKTGSANGSTSSAIDSTGANLLVVTASWYNAPTTEPTLTDSKSNTWTKLTTATNGQQSVAIWYCVPTSVGSSHTFTFAGTSSFTGFAAYAFSGADASAFVQESSIIGSGASVAFQIDPAAEDVVIIAAVNNVTNTSSVSVSDSFNLQNSAYSAGNSIAHSSAYKINEGSAVATPTISWTGSVAFAASYVVFAKADSARRTSVPVTSTNAFFSPYGWYSDGAAALQSNNIKSDATYAITTNTGNYIKTSFTGTSLRMKFDLTTLRALGITALQYPAIEVSIDGGAYSRTQIVSGSDCVVIASGLSAGTHTAKIVLAAAYVTQSSRWTVPANALKVTGFLVDDGESLAAPTLETNRAIFYGDSISEGYDNGAQSGLVADQNARQSWATLIGDQLDAEYGIIGFASQGYNVAVSEIPACKDAWDDYSNAKSRLVSSALSPAPDYIVSGHGTNDTNGAALTTVVTTLLGNWRTAAPSAKIFVLAPPSGTMSSLSDAVTAAADVETRYVNPGVNYGTTPAYVNGIHLSTAGQVAYSTDCFAIMEPDL